jgi:penicillin-binding protein 1A
VIDYAHRFGITSEIPAYLPIALGAADMLLIEHTAAFTTFPNDGVRVSPRYILKVEDYSGRVLEEDYPQVHDVISARTARVMTGLLREVVLHGTAMKANKLNHPLAGKTGTTNDFTDAWFVGFSPSITAGVWMGFDDKGRSLGNKESGGVAALPLWIEFMQTAIKQHPTEEFAAPPPEDPAVRASRQRPDKPDAAPGDEEGH